MLKVLILEDSEKDAVLMVRVIRRAGLKFEWVHAQNKTDFEELLSSSDIILADYNLPAFNALQVLRWMKKQELDIPIIVVTGTICSQKALECIAEGAVDYLFKDRLERLGIAVSRALQQKQIDQEKHRLQSAQAQFIQNVSHELRTPLGLITGHADLLVSKDVDFSLGPLNTHQQKSVNVICKRAEQLNKLVNDILVLMELDQVRLDGGYSGLSDLTTLDLGKTLLQMMADFEPLANDGGISLISDIEVGVLIYSSAKLVSAMLDNLLSNAIKFTPKGSVTVTLRSTAGNVILSVKDTGIGMTQDTTKRIFDRFCQANGTTTRTYGGTGLGLSVVREVAHSLGGYIAVESKLGAGSQFTITLPHKKE